MRLSSVVYRSLPSLSTTGDVKESRAIKALLAVFACVILFFAIFHQNGDALTVWAEDHTDREMSAGVADIADQLGMAQIVENSAVIDTSNSLSGYTVDFLFSKHINLPDQSQSDRAFTKDYLKKLDIYTKSSTYGILPKLVKVNLSESLRDKIETFTSRIKDSVNYRPTKYICYTGLMGISSNTEDVLVELYQIPSQQLPIGLNNKNYLKSLEHNYNKEIKQKYSDLKKLEQNNYKLEEKERDFFVDLIKSRRKGNLKEMEILNNELASILKSNPNKDDSVRNERISFLKYNIDCLNNDNFEINKALKSNQNLFGLIFEHKYGELFELNVQKNVLKFVSNGNPFIKFEGKIPNLKLYSTELYQSMNPFWVVVLTPVVVGFFGWMRRRKREPSTPTKIAIGLIITALSALVMVGAVFATNDMTIKAGSMWLFASYGVITIGELCLSPMGLSLVSKLSPPRITALMMGGYFLAISVGNKLSGMLSSLWETFPQKENFFYLNFGLVLAAAIILILMLKWLNSVMRENNVQ